jgi:hypothetical protein
MLAVGLPVLIAVVVSIVLIAVKRRLEKGREKALAGMQEQSADLSSLNRIERAIYTSEVFWKDATGIIQDRLFQQLGYLVESVERFNRSLSAVPTTVDNRIPPAVAMVGTALGSSAGVFRSAASTFQRAAENIAEYGQGYSAHMELLRGVITDFS